MSTPEDSKEPAAASEDQKPLEDGADQDQEMMNMFATVWVKVEVGENDDDETWTPKSELNNESRSSRKRKSKKPTKQLKCDSCDYTTVYKNCLKAHKLGHLAEKPYSCEFCNYGTKYSTALQRHLMIKHQDKCPELMQNSKLLSEKFKCPHCDYETPFKWNLKCHLRKHKLEKQFKCPHCPFETAYRHNFHKHSRVHQDSAFKCDKCPFVTKYKGHIHRHLAVMHNERTNEANVCELCDFSTLEKWRLNMHKQRSTQEEPIKCMYCNFETKYSCQFKKHKALHFSEFRNLKINQHLSSLNASLEQALAEKIKNEGNCDENQSNTDNSRETQLEPRTQIPEIAPSHSENQLNNSENLLNNLTSQLDSLSSLNNFGTSSNEIPLYLGLSTKSGSSSNNLQMQANNFESSLNNLGHSSNDFEQPTHIEETIYDHPDGHSHSNNYTVNPNCLDWSNIQVLESNVKERPFQCVMCNYMSKFKASVQRHFQRHHTGNKNRPYKCVNCDFSTKTKDQIALHNKRSKSETVLNCQFCNFDTLFKCKLVMHQKTHYAFKCNLCDYSCKHKHELTKHFGICHLGTGLKCRFCDYVTSRRDSLLSHETIHTKVKPHACSFCDYTSIRQSLLDTHVKKYHRDIIGEAKIISKEKIEALKIDISEHKDIFSSNSNANKYVLNSSTISSEVQRETRQDNVNVASSNNSQNLSDFSHDHIE